MRSIGATALVALGIGFAACSNSNNASSNNDAGNGADAGAVTFWQDVAPIYNDKCVRCHQAGGIGPFRLDTYADAKAFASFEKLRVNAGTMPPYFMVHDDSCGAFQHDATLTDAQKATINAWIDGGTPEGTPATLTLPVRPSLANPVDITSPTFMPVAQGGDLAQFDEYRCFLVDSPRPSDGFITAYDVAPGDASIVHHVIVFNVDPTAMADDGVRTNATVMQALQDASPTRAGWPCFGGAGDGINASGAPVTWAPGQGIVNYPAGMGVPLHPTDKLVIQIHYNLADPATVGRTDKTTVHLQFADSVSRQIGFVLPDAFLDSLGNTTPDTLPAGQADAKYTWTRTGRQLGLAPGTSVDLLAVMPHMHGRGVRQFVRIGPAGNLACAAHLENWSFHWQEFYFYKTPIALTATTQVQVTCEYDTSADTMPVLPGWGTRNEMCLAVLMIAFPPQ
jgi:hypothetical protein